MRPFPNRHKQPGNNPGNGRGPNRYHTQKHPRANSIPSQGLRKAEASNGNSQHAMASSSVAVSSIKNTGRSGHVERDGADSRCGLSNAMRMTPWTEKRKHRT